MHKTQFHLLASLFNKKLDSIFKIIFYGPQKINSIVSLFVLLFFSAQKPPDFIMNGCL